MHYLAIYPNESLTAVSGKVAAVVTNPEPFEEDRHRGAQESSFLFGGWQGQFLITLNARPYCVVQDGTGIDLFRMLNEQTDWKLELTDDFGRPIIGNKVSAQSA